MLATISKWGNSLGVRIPRIMAEQMHIAEGESVELLIDNDHLIIQKVYQLKTLLEQITPDNLHEEIDTGSPVGKEIW